MGWDSIALAKIKVQLQEQDVAKKWTFFENSTIQKALVIADSENNSDKNNLLE